MKALCVFIGANFGKNSLYLQATQQLGKELAQRNITLIYGGGKLGLMGALADATLQNKGRVVGVITKQLYDEEAHTNLSHLIVVDSMKERTQLMSELADGFIALPGGLGTLEEVFEIWNTAKMKLHQKPCGLLNTANYFDKLIEFVTHSVNEDFSKQEVMTLIKINKDPIKLLDDLIQKKIELHPHQEINPTLFRYQ